MNSIELWRYRLSYQCKYRLGRLKCILTDHDIRPSFFADYYCARCDIRNPEDKVTLFRLLNHRYCWLVGAEWEWFDKLDNWLCERYHMPSWWEY